MVASFNTWSESLVRIMSHGSDLIIQTRITMPSFITMLQVIVRDGSEIVPVSMW